VALAERRLRGSLADLLETVAARDRTELDASQRVLDNRLRELLQVSGPAIRVLLRGRSARQARRDLAAHTLVVIAARSVAGAARSAPAAASDETEAAKALGGAARALSADPPETTSAVDFLNRADYLLFAGKDEGTVRAATASMDDATTVRRGLIRLHDLLADLAGASADERAETPPVPHPAHRSAPDAAPA
jgi:hypothetical protein